MTRTARWIVLALVALLATSCRFESASSSKPPPDATVVRVTATPAGCPPRPARVPPGPVEVIVSNLDAPTVSEIEVRSSDLSQVLGEKENLIAGLSGQFSIQLVAGRYIVNCPGAAQSHWSLVASGPTH